MTDELPRPILDAAVRAVRAVPNLVIAGVDILYRLGQDPSQETYTVIEMNSRPHIGVNMYPTQGVGRDVPKAYLDYLFPESVRPETEGSEMLTMDVNQVQPLLRAGIARSVQLMPLPEHGYPIRRMMIYSETERRAVLRPSQGRRIQRLAQEWGVAGRLYRKGSEIHLLIGADSHDAVDSIREHCENFFGQEVAGTAKASTWHGALLAGFQVSTALLRPLNS